MLIRLDFSEDELLDRHLRDFESSVEEIEERRLRHPSLEHLRAARDTIRAASAAFDSWRYSSDPEYSHLPGFQSESLRFLEIAREAREAAAAKLD
jgi:hypothetical protein